MPPEKTPIQDEIHALLDKAESASDTVKDLVRTCLQQYRADCGAALECYQKGMMEVMSSGGQEGLEDLAVERDGRIGQDRQTLKVKLERLLKTAEKKNL